MSKHFFAVAIMAAIWATPSHADIFSDYVLTFGDQSPTSVREPGACWLRSKDGWQCFKLNGNQCKTVARTNKNRGRYAAHPKSCDSTRAPR